MSFKHEIFKRSRCSEISCQVDHELYVRMKKWTNEQCLPINHCRVLWTKGVQLGWCIPAEPKLAARDHDFSPEWPLNICLTWKSLSHVQLFAIPWTVARQAPLSMGFFRQEHWSGLPFPSPGDLPDPGIESGSPALPRWILYHLSHQIFFFQNVALWNLISWKEKWDIYLSPGFLSEFHQHSPECLCAHVSSALSTQGARVSGRGDLGSFLMRMLTQRLTHLGNKLDQGSWVDFSKPPNILHCTLLLIQIFLSLYLQYLAIYL